MKRFFLIACVVAIGVIFSTMAMAGESQWRLRLTKDDITVHTRRVEGFPILEFKADMMVAASLEAVITLFEDASRTPEWYHQCKRMDFLQDNATDEKLYYFVIDLPWPVAERDAAF